MIKHTVILSLLSIYISLLLAPIKGEEEDAYDSIRPEESNFTTPLKWSTFSTKPEQSTLGSDPNVLSLGSMERDAERGQFKYLVLLNVERRMGMKSCAGTLISQNHVLTSANCIDGYRSIRMYFGIVYKDYKNNAVQRRAIDVIQHPEFNRNTLENDISILRANSPVDMSERIGTIALPSPYDNEPEYFSDSHAIAIGWGLMTNGNNLEWTRVYLPAQGVCKDKLRNLRYFSDIHICTDRSAEGSVDMGDGGFPLIHFTAAGQPVLIGIISWAPVPRNRNNQFIDVFTRVSEYSMDIHKTIGFENF